ncbi:unnamed protein product [Symbiodinium natans]|uniref:EF-hand domain-containing protein n=1 Tax=Symbiodinium natans TaxID=878477 RepID=A0A812URJ3_9DINO|nr:unnamed protein product [Symbiodinium natans]
MAQEMRPGRKKAQLALEDAELRSLRIPSTAHRGALSPSKHSYLPTLQEQAREDRPPAASGSRKFGSSDALVEADSKREKRHRPETHVLTDLSADLLEHVKEEFLDNGGVLDGEQFVKAMMRNLDMGGYDRPGKSAHLTGEEPVLSSATKAAAVMDLFQHVDVHGEGAVSWEDVSNYFIEQGMSGGDEFTVDSIKTYEVSQVQDTSKHETPVEKLVYLEPIDSLVCLSRGSRSFRLYEPKRCTLKHMVPGHRGSVINCCYVDAWSQIATTAADMTICFWDSHLQLRNRLAAKDVQLCLQWDNISRSLFSGAIDGTLSRWDLNSMTLADIRKGNHKKAINDLLMAQDINLLASASSDGSILMWDTATMKPKKTFKGHKKGTFSLAYSMDYHCLLTAGLDQEALVWNPYVERVPIFRLKGHTHALCGVSVVPGTPQILSADVAGTFRLWDMRSFRCVQSFGGNATTLNDLNTFCVMPPHHRLAAGASRVILHDYMDEWGGESVTDTGGVTDALYNPNAGEFYTVSKQTVKAWNANTGVLYKVLRDITQDEITAACIADNGRKIYLGDAKGRVQSHGLNNGVVLSVFDQHPTDISCLDIWKGTNKLFSSSWDGTVKIHTDEGSRPPQLKAEFKNHRDGVTCLAASEELLLLASGSTDMQVVLYDLKTMKFETALSRFQHVIAAVDFLPKRCLLVVADQGGHVSFWRVRPHPEQWTCTFHFRNLPIINGSLPSVTEVPPAALAVPVAALRVSEEQLTRPSEESAEDEVLEPPLIYTADAKGVLRVWTVSQMCKKRGVHAVDVKDLFEQQRSGKMVATSPPRGGSSKGRTMGQRQVRNSNTPQVASPPLGRTLSSQTSMGNTAFLTGVDIESEAEPKSGYPNSLAPPMTASSGMRSWTVSQQDAEVQLLYEEEAHDDSGIISLYLTEGPRALVSTGLDRRVRTWSLQLDRLGTLMQSHDRHFRFPHDPVSTQEAKFQDASDLLQRYHVHGYCLQVADLPKTKRSSQYVAANFITSYSREIEELFPGCDDSAAFAVISNTCLVLYTLELGGFGLVHGPAMCRDWMIVLDSVIVLCGYIELILESISTSEEIQKLSILRALRLVRIFRLMRLLRRIRALRELYKLVTMMATCLKTLLWSFFFCFIVMTIWAMLLVEVVNPLVLKMNLETTEFADCDWCQQATSSVMYANLLLFQTVIAGDSWGRMANPLIRAYPETALIFIGSSLTLVFGVLNMIVAVVVDTFAEARAHDILNLAEEMEQDLESDTKFLSKLFERIDTDRSGRVTLDELIEGARKDPEFQSRLRVMDIDEVDLQQLFEMIDVNGEGSIEASDFIWPLSRWVHDSKTAPRFIKYNMLRTMEQQEELYLFAERQFEQLSDSIGSLRMTLASSSKDPAAMSSIGPSMISEGVSEGEGALGTPGGCEIKSEPPDAGQLGLQAKPKEVKEVSEGSDTQSEVQRWLAEPKASLAELASPPSETELPEQPKPSRGNVRHKVPDLPLSSETVVKELEVLLKASEMRLRKYITKLEAAARSASSPTIPVTDAGGEDSDHLRPERPQLRVSLSKLKAPNIKQSDVFRSMYMGRIASDFRSPLTEQTAQEVAKSHLRTLSHPEEQVSKHFSMRRKKLLQLMKNEGIHDIGAAV